MALILLINIKKKTKRKVSQALLSDWFLFPYIHIPKWVVKEKKRMKYLTKHKIKTKSLSETTHSFNTYAFLILSS